MRSLQLFLLQPKPKNLQKKNNEEPGFIVRAFLFNAFLEEEHDCSADCNSDYYHNPETFLFAIGIGSFIAVFSWFKLHISLIYWSIVMVRFAFQNGKTPVYLFDKEKPNHLMRERQFG